MSAGVGPRRAALLLVAAAAGVAVVAIAWRFLPVLLGDPWIRVHAHNGRWVLEPCVVIPAGPGEPPAF